MLLNSNYIRSLSEAVFGHFESINKTASLISDIKELNNILSTNNGQNFQKFLDDLLISRDEKIKIIKNIFDKKISPDLVYFFTLIIKLGCESFFKRILDNILVINQVSLNKQTVFFESYYKMDDKKIEKYIFEYFPNLKPLFQQKLITITSSVNKQLLGGFKIQVGNSLIDNTILFSLNKAVTHLKSN
ncbi:F0F1 ATP synthase subunit delta [Mycoplasma sp. SG1]|uniref:F0F1 ATP synthase subunit delta n=1 Tax=Mycoplasma sp. SG1 TaxID=2810348 RepID=UPI002024E69B|nr:F0F1 ATP synthase subunit delta [Mycoplasma sp. SG1]URM52971.1 F0F1 ATP synthase subunit delta [Mycoplasma sp. SG1]